MSNSLVSENIGSGDFSTKESYPTRTLESDPKVNFTDRLNQNESEQENLGGLEANDIIITGVAINASQSLKLRIDFYSKDLFDNSDLSLDSYIGSVVVDCTKYGRLA